MPEPTSPQFDALWTATYNPSPSQIHPTVARWRDLGRQNQERYGNRYANLSKEGQGHINKSVNALAPHGGGTGLSDDQMRAIIADPVGQHGPFFDTPEKQADAIDRVLGFDPHKMREFHEGDDPTDVEE